MRGATLVRLSHEDQPVRISRHHERVPFSRLSHFTLSPLPLQRCSASRAASDLLDVAIQIGRLMLYRFLGGE